VGLPAGSKQSETGLYIRSQNGLVLRDRRVQRLVAKMKRVMPWLQPSDIPAARRWAQLDVMIEMGHAMLRRDGLLNQDQEPRRLLSDVRCLMQTQLMYARELGMTPLARLQIKANQTTAALDIAKMAAELTINANGDAANGATADDAPAQPESEVPAQPESEVEEDREDGDR
jgi:hypothetical protein